MSEYNIYKDIASRTGGDIYIGVVGPVRTGKSTFIKRFMETLVLDNIEDEAKRERARDELPQSADGKTVMTTEPKFVPNEAVKVAADDAEANIRLIDCVGYLVDGAIGHEEGDKPRMVNTPWSTKQIPFKEAAELGTDKVIRDHSTIGVVVTTDGSITDIARTKYVDAEERVIKELVAIGKPFVVVLNTVTPESADTLKLADSIAERYDVRVVAMNVAEATADDFAALLNDVLMEFPVKRISVDLPKWMRALGKDHPVISRLAERLTSTDNNARRMKDFKDLGALFDGSEYTEDEPDTIADPATGEITLKFRAKEGLFYKVVSEMCNADVDDDYKLMSYVLKAGKAYKEYEKLRVAMEEMQETGYGIVMPSMEEMTLREPELMKRGSQFGVKLKASAPSIHLMRVDVETEVNPIIGSEQQSEDLVNYLMGEFENNKQGIWETNMFGKSLSSLVKEDLNGKISNMPPDAQRKLRRTVTRIVNEGKGGVLCILL